MNISPIKLSLMLLPDGRTSGKEKADGVTRLGVVRKRPGPRGADGREASGKARKKFGKKHRNSLAPAKSVRKICRF
jgi:hypothetical protein